MTREIKPFILGNELGEEFIDFTPRPVEASVQLTEPEAPKGERLTHPSWSEQPVKERIPETSSPNEGSPATMPSESASGAKSEKTASNGPKPPALPTASSADATKRSDGSSGGKADK